MDYLNHNRLYRETVQSLPSMISASGISEMGKNLPLMHNVYVLFLILKWNFCYIPAITLKYYRDGKAILESRVIVGEK